MYMQRGACFLVQDSPLCSAIILHTNPDVVRDIHLDFLRAGAEVLITATFSVSGLECAPHELHSTAIYVYGIPESKS